MQRLSLSRRRELIVENTEVVVPALVPEISLRLTTSRCPLWSMGEKELSTSVFPEPYWAFAWAGGQGLARYILDHPTVVDGKRVLDVATGSGLVAIAAAMGGAQTVVANDIDSFSEAAVELNGALNGVMVEFEGRDLLGSHPGNFDVVVAGDICYEEGLSLRVTRWLSTQAAGGARVLVGDPGSATFPRAHFLRVARYRTDTVGDGDDGDVRRASVFRLSVSDRGKVE